MKTKLINLLIITALITITILLLIFPKDVMEAVNFGISIWKDNLIPALFPFFMVSHLLINYGFIELIGELFGKVMNNLFHLPGLTSFVLIGSLISGFPSSSKFTRELVINGNITDEEGTYLLTFTHFSNPLFVIGTIGTLLLNNKNIGICILIIHILTNFIIAFLFRPKLKRKFDSKISFRRAINNMHKKRMSTNKNFIEILTSGIFNTIQTLLLMLGIITIFLIIITIVNNIFVISPFSNSILSGVLEMTSGIRTISIINLSISLKAALIGSFISFGGLSVHMQVFSIISDTKIKYYPYFLARVIHAFLAGMLTYIVVSSFF